MNEDFGFIIKNPFSIRSSPIFSKFFYSYNFFLFHFPFVSPLTCFNFAFFWNVSFFICFIFYSFQSSIVPFQSFFFWHFRFSFVCFIFKNFHFLLILFYACTISHSLNFWNFRFLSACDSIFYLFHFSYVSTLICFIFRKFR